MGVIASDIDGTLIVGTEELPDQIVTFLSQLHEQGWTFIFLTGRTFTYGYHTLKKLPFPYYFCVQNGATVFEMPAKQVLLQRYLSPELLPSLEKIAEEEKVECAIYTGISHGHRVLYRSKRYSSDLREYLDKRQKVFMEEWVSVDEFAHGHITDFPAVKFFGNHEAVTQVAKRVETELHLHIPVVRDPFCEGYYLAQGTHKEVNKGKILQELIQQRKLKGPLIAAGDDKNDISLLEVADVGIVMANAPPELLRLGTLVAPPVEKMGIISGLKHAITLALTP